METLQLKHLASYLPFKLKMKSPHGFRPNAKESTGEPGIVYLTGDLYADIENKTFNSKYFKPILFPLSALTKEITVNGETFMPYDKIKEIYPNTPQFTDYIKGWMQYYGVMDSKCEYVCILKLFEWKIDVFGLIDAGLAESVTEDFNPYK